MVRWSLPLMIVALLAAPGRGQEKVEEPTARSRVVSVGLFKNGLAVVKREVSIPEAGTYRLDVAPEPVHGTFWVESDATVQAAVKLRDVAAPLDTSPVVDLQHDLAGKKVTLHFKGDKRDAVTGTVVKLAPPVAEEPMRPSPYISARLSAMAAGERYLILQTAKGRLYVNPSEVGMVQVDGADDTVTRRKPVLVLTVGKTEKRPTVHISYLAHGLAWAPSYRVDITDPKSLAIEMAAVLRNEMADVDGAEVRLISGYPSVEFAHVTSPLAGEATWARFFQELKQRGQGRDEPVLTQNTVLTNYKQITRAPVLDLSAIPEGEGVDLHFEPVGKHTLAKGEALSLTVGKARADYERVVEWTVPASPVARKYGGGSTAGEMWDVLHFKNPFKFPMTTAPAMVVEAGKFNGQRTAFWANVGEETNLRITRSLSVRTASREEEDAAIPNERLKVDDKWYTKVHLKGELRMSNHRKQPVKLHVRHRIRGIVSQIDGNPRVTTSEESLEDVNRIHQALWVLNLQPGEEKRIGYRYSVLVQR